MSDPDQSQLQFLRKLPWTQLRLFWGMVLLTTAIVVDMRTPWELSVEIAGLLAVELGAGGYQWVGKRRTQFNPVDVARAEQIRNGPPTTQPVITERRSDDEYGAEFAG